MPRILLILLALAGPVRAADKGLVAVLPTAAQADIKPVEKDTFEESIRTSAGDYLTPLGYTVLAGETTMQLLADNGVEAERACEASCALQAARELRAKLFISGSLAKLEGAFVAFVRLFDTETGKQLSSVRLEDESLRKLVKGFDGKAKEFFEKIETAPPPEPAKSEPVAQAEPAKTEPAPTPAKDEPPAPAGGEKVGTQKNYAIRLGLGGLNGVGGLGFAYDLGRVAIGVGTGLYLLSAGASADLFDFDGDGGFYADLSLVVASGNPLLQTVPATGGVGLGLTIGYDLHLADLLSIKVGAGPAVNSLTASDVRARHLLVDASVGLLF